MSSTRAPAAGFPGPASRSSARQAELGELPVIAEDLGMITKDVEVLRDALGFRHGRAPLGVPGADEQSTGSRTTACTR